MPDNELDVTKEKVEGIADCRVKERLAEYQKGFESREYNDQDSRRDFLKKAIKGMVGIGAVTLIPSAAGFDVTSKKGLTYFERSNSNPSFSINSDSELAVKQIGSSSEPISKIFADEIGSKSSSVENIHTNSINAQEMHSRSKVPNIVVFKDDGKAVADTEETRYEGKDIFDAANKAIYDKISADGGGVNLFVKPGVYSPSTTLTVPDNQIIRGFSIYSSIPFGCKIKQDNYSPGDSVFDFRLSDNRIKGFGFGGFEIEDEADNRNIYGLRMAQCDEVNINSYRGRGLRQFLEMDNCFNGVVRNIDANRCGDINNNVPSTKINAGTSIPEATNNILFEAVQGGPETEVAYIDVDGQTRLSFSDCHIEMSDPVPCLDCEDVTGASKIKLSNVEIKSNGGTSINVLISNGILSINGGLFESSETCIAGDNANLYVDGAHISPGSDSSSYGIDASRSRLFLSNSRIKGGDIGVLGDGIKFGHITGVTFQDTRLASIKVRNNARALNLSNIELINVLQKGDGSGDAQGAGAIYIDQSSSDISISNLVGSANKSNATMVYMDYADNINVDTTELTPKNSNFNDLISLNSSSVRSNKGTSTIDEGSISTTVTHNLSREPNPEDIEINLTGPFNDIGQLSVQNIGVSSFDIVTSSAPSSDTTVAWRAEL